MTYYDAWIEEPAAVDLVGLEQAESEKPITRSPFFPNGRAAYSFLRRGVQSATFNGYQVDWGCFAALMKRTEIEAFLVNIHEPRGISKDEHKHLGCDMRQLWAFVDHLPDDRWFKIVASEF